MISLIVLKYMYLWSVSDLLIKVKTCGMKNSVFPIEIPPSAMADACRTWSSGCWNNLERVSMIPFIFERSTKTPTSPRHKAVCTSYSSFEGLVSTLNMFVMYVLFN